MIGDVYLATALAIFIAIFGWSDKIFGLSKETKEKEANFIQKAGLTLNSYTDLKNVISSKNLDSVEKTKKIVSLIKNTKIKQGDKKIFDKLGDNNQVFLKLNHWTEYKKAFFIIIFLYLFLIGSTLMVIETLENLPELYSNSIIWFQSILLGLIILGTLIYFKINKFEEILQKNLNDLILMEI